MCVFSKELSNCAGSVEYKIKKGNSGILRIWKIYFKRGEDAYFKRILADLILSEAFKTNLQESC